MPADGQRRTREAPGWAAVGGSQPEVRVLGPAAIGVRFAGVAVGLPSWCTRPRVFLCWPKTQAHVPALALVAAVWPQCDVAIVPGRRPVPSYRLRRVPA